MFVVAVAADAATPIGNASGMSIPMHRHPPPENRLALLLPEE